MTITELKKEVPDLKRRVDLAETRLAQGDGRFEFITGQLRDVQLYLHSKFGDIDGRLDRIEGRIDRVEGRLDRIDGRLDRIDGRLDGVEGKIDALPRVIAELITKRG